MVSTGFAEGLMAIRIVLEWSSVELALDEWSYNKATPNITKFRTMGVQVESIVLICFRPCKSIKGILSGSEFITFSSIE